MGCLLSLPGGSWQHWCPVVCWVYQEVLDNTDVPVTTLMSCCLLSLPGVSWQHWCPSVGYWSTWWFLTTLLSWFYLVYLEVPGNTDVLLSNSSTWRFLTTLLSWCLLSLPGVCLLSLPGGSWQHWYPVVGCWGIHRGTYGLASRSPTETAKILPRNWKHIYQPSKACSL